VAELVAHVPTELKIEGSNHRTDKHFCIQKNDGRSFGRVFEWLKQDGDHSKTEQNGSVIEYHLITRPFGFRTQIDHLNTGLVWYSTFTVSIT
jgi:hypothetical protein